MSDALGNDESALTLLEAIRHEGVKSEENCVCGGGGAIKSKDGSLWFFDIRKYELGDFSMAVVQANKVLENQSQIVSGTFGTFVGVYDRHGGPMLPAMFTITCPSTFKVRKVSVKSQRVVATEAIQRAFGQTEEGFTTFVSELWSTQPHIATSGSCCLVRVIFKQTLFIANLGDSHVVLGKKVGNIGGITAIQLLTEHNANNEATQYELRELHPNDSKIVVLKNGVWRVKGIIQVSRSIGDVYMKHALYNREPLGAKFRLPKPMNMPILRANPTIISYTLQPNDFFLIFVSDGLWEHLSNEKAVDIVHSHQRAI